MDTAKTAKDFIEQYDGTRDTQISKEHAEEAMIDFAQYHVLKALKKAANEAKVISDPSSYTGNTGSEYEPEQIVSRKSIINAYSITNVK
jgi:ABC-type uncharacterized transport system substrate-binding protein